MAGGRKAPAGAGAAAAQEADDQASESGKPLVLAALASIPTRAHLLPHVLRSLRPQVDRLHVYLNGYTHVPDCVRELADEHILDPNNRGAEAKLYWSPLHSGVPSCDGDFCYLSCDDDFEYPANYAATMSAAVERWEGRAVVSAHGRTYRGRPSGWHDVVGGSIGNVHKLVPAGRWVNHGGSGVMAFDTRHVRPPNEWPLRNMVDAQLAVWAQRARVPMWLVPHPARWLKPLAYLDREGIFRTSQLEGHRRRSEFIAAHGREHGWELLTL